MSKLWYGLVVVFVLVGVVALFAMAGAVNVVLETRSGLPTPDSGHQVSETGWWCWNAGLPAPHQPEYQDGQFDRPCSAALLKDWCVYLASAVPEAAKEPFCQ